MKARNFKARLAYLLAATMSLGMASYAVPYVTYAAEEAIGVDAGAVVAKTETATEAAMVVSEAARLSVKEALKVEGQEVTTEGYIVGYGANGKVYLEAPNDKVDDVAIVIADSKDETDKNNVLIIKLTKGDPQNNWGLKTNKDLYGKRVVVKGTRDKAYGIQGITPLKSIGFADGDSNESEDRVEITATPESGNVARGTQVKFNTTTSGALYIDVNKTGFRPYDSAQGITIDEDTTVSAYVENGDYRSNEFKFEYKILREEAIENIRKKAAGERVKFKGIVTRISSVGFYVDDETAGMYVYGSHKGDHIAVGDEVEVEGVIDIYSQLVEVKNATVSKTGVTKEVQPIDITVDEFNQNGGKYESRLIRFKDVTLGNLNLSGNTEMTQDGKVANIYKICEGVKTGYDSYDVTAIGARYNETLQLTVANPEDISPVNGIEAFNDIIIKIGETFTLPENLQVVDGRKAEQKKITWNEAEVKKVNTKEKGTYKVTGQAEGIPVSVNVVVLTNEQLKISDIQGKSHTSPYVNQNVADIKGVVTAINGTKGFYMQDVVSDKNDETSDGIYVMQSNHKLAVGDLVSVTGKVEEYASDKTYLSITELKATKVKKEASNQPLPEAMIIGQAGRVAPSHIIDNDGFSVYDPAEDGIDFFESIEGMYVEVQDALVTGAKYSNTIPVVADKGAGSAGLVSPYGGVVISEDNSHAEVITLAKGMNTNLPDVNAGDVFNGDIYGVIDYYNGNYCLRTAKALPEIIKHSYDSNPKTSLEETKDGLRIASFNVENMGGNATADKMDGVTAAIVENLKCPDIVTLEEIQDNNGTTSDGTVDADVTFTRIVEGISKRTEGKVNYKYLQISPEDGKDGGAPGGNIRIGMLYNPERVQLAEGTSGDAKAVTKVTKAADGTAHLSLNPGRIDPSNPYFEATRKSLVAEFIFNGQKVFVIGNHFSSKGGDNPLFGSNQPPILSSEVKRLEQAKAVNTFIKEILAVDPKAKVVVLGDLNDFYYSKVVNQVADNALYNLMYKLPENERFTYVYGGRSQVLDNVLITKGLEAYTDVEVLNMNSIKSSAEQLSDHDPIVIRLNMDKMNAKPNSSNSSGNSGNSSSSSSSNDSDSNKDTTTKKEETKQEVTQKDDNTKAIEEAVKNKKEIIFNVDHQYNVTLSKAAVSTLLDSEKDLTIKANAMQVVFSQSVLKNLGLKDKNLSVKMTAVAQKEAEKINAHQTLQPMGQVTEFTVESDSKALTLTEPIVASLKVDAKKVKDVSKLTLVRYEKQADGSYRAVKLGGKYDQKTQSLTAHINEPGLYGVAEAKQLIQAQLKLGDKQILVNGRIVTAKVAPMAVEGKTMLPLRAVGECLGGTVKWNGKAKTVTVTIDGNSKTFTQADGMIAKDGSTLIPIRQVSEAFGAYVLWISETNSVEIVK